MYKQEGKKNEMKKLEKLSTADAVRSLKFAEVVVVCMDITKPFEEQDLRIADLVGKHSLSVCAGRSVSSSGA